MAKNEKTQNNKSTTDKLAELEAQREKLMQELQKLDAKREEENRERTERLGVLIDSLPEEMGVTDLQCVVSLIKQRINGTLGKLSGQQGPRASYKRLSEDEGNAIDAALKEGEHSIAKCTALASKYGVSTQTVYLRAKALGLTQVRAKAAVAA